nr:integrase, catalytic region, zinc finger, CCHC-type, peptidase aspartic, catalytic [Tanacetum cinerariifolium]
MLKDSIDNGPYQLKPEITVKETNGVTDIRRPQRVEDLAGQEKLHYDIDIKQDFLADSLEETNDCEDLQLQATINFRVDHVDAYDSDCDDKATTNAIFMANLSPVDSGRSKHMTGHCDKIIDFVSKFIGMKMQKCKVAKSAKQKVKSEWKPTGRIFTSVGIRWKPTGRMFIMEGKIIQTSPGLGHNLFFVGQFCDSDLEVAFRKHICFVWNLEGVDLLSGSRGSNIYKISMADTMKSSPIFLVFKASKTKSWLWHHRLSHLNFGTINQLAKHGLVKGLPKL